MFRKALLIALAALSGCSSQHIVTRTARGATGDGVEYFFEDGGAVALIDGEVRGSEAFDEIGRRFGIRFRGELRDHPRIDAIRDAVKRLEEAERSNAPLEQWLVDAAEIPFEEFVGRKLVDWADGDPKRSAELLDQALLVDLGATVRTLTASAVQAPDTSDARLAQWAEIEGVRSEVAALRALLHAPSAGRQTRLRLLANVDDIDSDERAEFLIEVSERLVGEPAVADALAARLEALYSDDRARVAQTWAKNELSTPALGFALLGGIDDFFGDERALLVEALIPRLATQPGGPDALAQRLGNLFSDGAAMVALRLVTYPENSAELCRAALDHIDELYSSDQVRVLEALIDGPGFSGPNQRACLQVADDELFGADRQAVLKRIAESARTQPSHRRTAEILLAR